MAKVGYIKLNFTLSVTSRAPLAKALSLSSNFTLNINIGTILGKFEFGEGPVVNKLVHDRIAVLKVLPTLRESRVLVHLNPGGCLISLNHLAKFTFKVTYINWTQIFTFAYGQG